MTKLSPAEYDAWYETPLGSLCDRLEKDAIFALLKPKGLVLDIGCGTGNYSLEIATRGAKAVGIDSSFDMALFAKRKGDEEGLELSFVVGKAEEMPFKGNVFYGVIGITALCFISSTEREMLKTDMFMKKDRHLILGIRNKTGTWAAIRRIKAIFK